ncbi:MAG: hypothetical protein KGY74_02865 [Candidatus Cloacimonetes bacterium]|nr:hypothetical protein [Candidatus Cloacimonadota bacterium]
MTEKNKKKYNRIIVIVLILVAVFFIYWNNFRQVDENKVLAVVGNEKILYSDVSEAIGQNQQLSTWSQDQVLDQLINMKISKIYADSNKYFAKQEYKEEFEWQKEEAKKGLMASVYLEQKAGEKGELDDEFYKSHIKENPYYKIMTIFKSFSEDDSAKVEKQMDQAYEKLLEGEDFKEVRTDYMEDKYLDPNNAEEIIEVNVLKSLLPRKLDVGEFSQPVYTENGYYIIKRLPDPSLTEIKEKLGNDIKTGKKNEYMRNYADSLKSQITMYEANLRKVLNNPEYTANEDLTISALGDYKMRGAYLTKFIQNSFPQTDIEDENLNYIKNIARELTLQNYLYNKAKEAGIENTPEYKNKAEAELAMFEQGWENFIISKVYNKIISEETNVTEDEIVNYYNTHQEDFTSSGEVQPLESVRYKIKYKLQDKKINNWFENVKNDLNIKVERK